MTGGQAARRLGGSWPLARIAAVVCTVLAAQPPSRLAAQSSRLWRPDERAYVTDLSRVTAVAATQTVVYAATPNGLAVYDAGFRVWRETVGPMDGYPGGLVTTMTADPSDDTAWLGGRGFWAAWHAFGRRWETGTLPGVAELVVLDARDPARGAFYRVGGQWHVVSRMGGVAMPAIDVPPPGRRHGPLRADEVRRRMPAFEAVRLRIERDDFLRSWPITAVAATPLGGGGDLFVATDGNGLFRVDAVSAQVERLPAGLLGSAIGAVAVRGGTVCAGSEDRLGTRRRALTCFDEELRRFEYFERGAGLAGLPGAEVRDVAIADRAIWLATEQGLLRIDRRAQRAEQLRGDDLPSDDVGALMERAGGVWAGTTSGLVWVADTGRSRADPTDVSLAVSGLALRRDTLWLATSFGVLARPAAPDLEATSVRVRVEGQVVQEAALAIGAGDGGVLAATHNRLIWIAGDSAVWLPPPPLAVGGGVGGGEVRAIAADGDGFWVAGARGIGLLRPATAQWLAFIVPGDLPAPAIDLLASGRWLWVATERGVLRFDKRVVQR